MRSPGDKASVVKNTMFLYFRMLFTLIVSLYTSRVILRALGETDFGIHNVVGGFVTMFTIFASGLFTTTQRFFNFDLGRGDRAELHRTFSASVQIYIIIAVLITLLLEIGGIWFLENKLTIPQDRMSATKWVFQFAVFTLVLGLVSVPYNALIVAHEKMKAFAYISVYEATAKLIIAYLIYATSYDRLIVYAALLFSVQLTVRVIYTSYCKKHFEECYVDICLDTRKIKELYSFAGWAIFGGLASVGFTQGLNVLLNMFFNPAVNAARGIAVQVQQTVNNFAINFQTALNPQIIKSYAAGEKENMYKLVFASSKYSFLLIYIISLPLLIETPLVLRIWLEYVPEYSVIFLRLIMITSIVDAMANPFMRTADATGKIKKYQLTIGSILLTIIPISYLVLKFGAPAYSVFLVHLVICVIAFVIRLIIVRDLERFSIMSYFKDVVIKVLIVALISPVVPVLIWFNQNESIYRLVLITITSIMMTSLTTYYIVLSTTERSYIHNKVKKIFFE